MMTEKEAREKWCPFARTALSSFGVDQFNAIRGTANRVMAFVEAADDALTIAEGHANCIASDCAVWRFASPETLERFYLSDHDHLDLGYCGLAGDPR